MGKPGMMGPDGKEVSLFEIFVHYVSYKAYLTIWIHRATVRAYLYDPT